MKLIKSITNCYQHLSSFGKLLVILSLLLLIVVAFKHSKPEGFNVNLTSDKFLFKQGTAVYDDFYAEIYDYLVFNTVRNDYEIGAIFNNTSPNEKSVVADIGCRTGHRVADLSERNLQVIGIDVSPSMVEKAKTTFPDRNFKVGDAVDRFLFNTTSLTHVMCLDFSIYHISDKAQFFNNCMAWLMPGGYLIVHLVDKYKVAPMLPTNMPLYSVSNKNHRHHAKIAFKDFMYNANFKLHDNNTATLDEKFKFRDGRVRKQEQTLYIEDLPTIVQMAQDAGFILHAKMDMVQCAHENQYLYVFVK
ncbi:MAG: class I SAM-dependent methyltransferase [Flavobacterium sp.]